MNHPLIAAVFLGFMAAGACACSCVPAPPPLNAQTKPESRAFAIDQWKRRFNATPHVFSAEVVEMQAVPSNGSSLHQTVGLGKVQALVGRVPGNQEVFNSLTNCPANLSTGQRYIFFAADDMQVSHCTIQPHSAQAQNAVLSARAAVVAHEAAKPR